MGVDELSKTPVAKREREVPSARSSFGRVRASETFAEKVIEARDAINLGAFAFNEAHRPFREACTQHWTSEQNNGALMPSVSADPFEEALNDTFWALKHLEERARLVNEQAAHPEASIVLTSLE